MPTDRSADPPHDVPRRSLRRVPLLAAVLLLVPAAAAAQQPASGGDAAKPALEHGDTYDWNRIDGEGLSRDGSLLHYVLEPYEGDPTLVIRDLDAGTELRVERGRDPELTGDHRYLVFLVGPAEAAVDSLRAEGVGEDDLPPDTLGVLDLRASFDADPAAPRVERVPAVRSFRVAEEESPVVAVHLESEEEATAGDEGAGEPEAAGAGADEGDDEGDEGPEASPLELRTPGTDRVLRFAAVTSYRLGRAGQRLIYAAQGDGDAEAGVHAVEVGSGTVRPLATGEGRYRGLALDRSGEQAAFLTDRDDRDAEEPAFALYHARLDGDGGARRRVAAGTPGVPDGWAPGEHGEPEFSRSGERLFFGTAPLPDPGPTYEDTVPEHERVEVDVWNWRDDHLQPMQLVQREDERRRTYRAVLHLDDDRVIQLADEQVPELTLADDGDADHALGETDVPYRKLLSWDGRYHDAYAVDLRTGERRRVAERVRGFGGTSISPEGRWIYWWDGAGRDWFAAPTEGGGEPVNLSRDVPHPVHDLTDDRPEPPGPWGAAGWTADDGAFLLYDRHDVWLVDPRAPSEPRNVTGGLGRREDLTFRHVATDPDREHVPADEEVLLSAFHRGTKASGFYRGRLDDEGEPRRLIVDDRRFDFEARAADAGVLLVTRESVREFPDLHVADPSFGSMEKVSDANPQQDDFRWGTAELVEWTSARGDELQGILYTPDGFDRSRKHPMMVYFYERMSDGLHRYRSPTPGGSSIAIPFYLSRGYVVFVPDIPYEVPYPGDSALDAVVPGVLSVVRRGFVDRERIGVQGHSWGGYQIAYMITRTDLFAAAEAGAPVVNMTSAYGGIRWGSGMSRMFQYERTQSRIGESLWDATAEYVDNSPLFYVPRIDTPVLFMHNDEDGAVPWYQGIEFFVALRRLGKPAWMLNYNGERHGVRETKNQKDWAIRMQQFFDHYLKDAPAPVWMVEGVPAVEKGRTLGLEPGSGPAVAEGGEESGGGR